MERREDALAQLRGAQDEYGRLRAEADKLARAYETVQRQMRDSGEYARRVAAYKRACKEASDQADAAKRCNEKRGNVLALAFFAALILFLVLMSAVVTATGGSVIAAFFLLALFAAGGYIVLRNLDRIWPSKEFPPSPRQEAYGLFSCSAFSQDSPSETIEEEQARRTRDEAERRAETAEYALIDAQEAYEVACMTPEEQTAYWAKKRYELALEQRDLMAETLSELEIIEQQAEEAAKEARENAEEQTRALRDQTEELDRLREEVRRLRQGKTAT